ncbi:MAG TPA: PKD domain-containing protein, partial [Candidatus Marinimicrobia bacterium]|nr:PKD domain-containing protein [Candidatus Neomarinimicrobiota bacterium]
LNMKNGVTDQLDYFNVTNNSSLTCIETLDPDYATTNWTSDNGNIDAGVTFDVICGAEAQTHWYVATTGSDVQGSGTLESPLANIQTAINATTNGDTVSVATGTYVENISYSGKNISVLGEDRETTIIDGNQEEIVVWFGNGEDSTAILSNFTITNGSQGIKCFNNSNPRIGNNIITGNAYSGPVFSGAWGAGISVHSSSPKIYNNVIANNFVFSNDNYGSTGGGLHIYYSDLTDFHNNTIVNNHSDWRGGGIYLHGPSSISGANNIIWGNDAEIGPQIFQESAATSFFSYSDIQGGWEGEGNINIDPMFVDAANGDYHLLDWSPCIGAGQDGVDMGSYENALANPRYLLAVDSVYFVHGDTAIVPIRNQLDYPELNSIGLKITGFQDKLSFVGLVTDSTTIFGSLGWITEYNNTDTLLITASAGSNPLESSGVLFALKLAVPDTLSSQFIPITITEFTGNEEYTDFLVTPGGVQVVWEPLVGFTSTESTGSYPMEVTFTDTSHAGTYPINEWAWDLGDDSTASEPVVTHTYNYPGVYDVTLRIEDEFGLADSLTSVGLVQVDTLYGDVSWNALVQHYDASLILQDLAEM